MDREMKFIVKKNGGGSFRVETKGFTGTQCESAVEAVVGALNAKTVDQGDTDERWLNNDPNVLVDSINR